MAKRSKRSFKPRSRGRGLHVMFKKRNGGLFSKKFKSRKSMARAVAGYTAKGGVVVKAGY